jgi:hypothetical protein
MFDSLIENSYKLLQHVSWTCELSILYASLYFVHNFMITLMSFNKCVSRQSWLPYSNYVKEL